VPGATPGLPIADAMSAALFDYIMNAPDVTYDFYIKDAYAHWSIHSDSIHISESASESGVNVAGVKADQMFSMCRNALACNRQYSVFHELSNRPPQVEQAKEMIAALQLFVDENTKDEDNKEEESNDD
jgi:hypothetical protein